MPSFSDVRAPAPLALSPRGDPNSFDSPPRRVGGLSSSTTPSGSAALSPPPTLNQLFLPAVVIWSPIQQCHSFLWLRSDTFGKSSNQSVCGCSRGPTRAEQHGAQRHRVKVASGLPGKGGDASFYHPTSIALTLFPPAVTDLVSSHLDSLSALHNRENKSSSWRQKGMKEGSLFKELGENFIARWASVPHHHRHHATALRSQLWLPRHTAPHTHSSDPSRLVNLRGPAAFLQSIKKLRLHPIRQQCSS